MTNKISVYAATRTTVHCWAQGTKNKTFGSLKEAIEYAAEHSDELSSIEVFVHAAGGKPQIICDQELSSLVEQVCSHH